MSAWLAALLFLQEPPAPLREFCGECHGDGARKGGFAYDAPLDPGALRRWSHAVLSLQSHVMPPPRKPQPTPAARREILDWIDRHVFKVDPDRPDPGHPGLRRLNRSEFDHAVRDVLGVESRPAAASFPPDDTGYGFDTVGDVLTLSPALLEKILAAARQVADEAAAPRPVGQVGVERPGAKLSPFRGNPAVEKNGLLLPDGAEAGVDADVAVDAVYRVAAQVAGTVEVLVDGRPAAAFEGPAGPKRVGKPFEALVPLSTGRRRLSLRARGEALVSSLRLRGPFNPVSPPLPPLLAGLGRPVAPPRLVLSGEDTEAGEGKSSLDTGAAWFASRGYRRAPLAIRRPGRYRFRIKAGAQQAGPDPVRFEFRIGDVVAGPFEIRAAEQRHEILEAEVDLAAGDHVLQAWFLNPFRHEASRAERLFWLHEFSVEGPLRADAVLVHADTAPLLVRTARRLFRRPLAPEEARRIGDLARTAEAAGLDPLGALRQGLVALLASPAFLFWNAPVPAGPAERGSVPIDEIALASRLSAFLWSSVPDEELLALAEAGGLRRAFPAQVARLLADPRSKALVENFAGQWLELRSMALVAPDATAFPSWNAALAADLRRETELLVGHVLRENLPVLELFSADYTFANARVAAHYGLDGVEGDAFRRVPLTGTPRRGVLSHASLLTLTSHPDRTSPVKRGKFILEKILGTPPPPAPKDVPPLPEPGPEAARLPLRARLEAHRSNPACASCHAFMDPPGFAFEHYDGVGRRRETDGGRPVDASGTLTGGRAFKDAEEFRRILVEERGEDLLRSLAEQLLTYALGRGIGPADKPAVAEIVRRTRAEGGRMHALLRTVAESLPFQRMRAPEGPAGVK
jgi:hypothetical protein